MIMSGESKKNAKEQSRCFVCDAEVLGRFYALATCRTQSSRTRVIEKLGELVGEGYMVVISEDDVICRSCGILVNTLDRLETEMRQARDYVLHFLEKKYSLADGELRGDKPKPCQPPQITRSEAKETADLEGKKILTNSQTWLQCNKCKYTSNLNSFMTLHASDHAKESAAGDLCGHIVSENQQESKRHCHGKANDLGNKENETDNSDLVVNNEAMELTLLEPIKSVLPITQTTPPPLMGLSNCDHLYASSALPPSVSTSREPTCVLQPMDGAFDNWTTKTIRLFSRQETEAKKRESRKQINLKEDGSLEMVEIPWSEMEASDIDSTIVFE